MENVEHVSLQVIAKPAAKAWTVDIIEDGVVAFSELSLTDPLAPDQSATCRWYIEQYVQKSPFSTDRAQEAQLRLRCYPEDILRQLRLRSLLSSRLKQGAYNFKSFVVFINVCQNAEVGGCSENTIHRLLWETLEDPQLWDHPSWTVVVRRCLSVPGMGTLARTHSLGSLALPRRTTRVNILLVVARDTSRSPLAYEDVSPFLAADALMAVQKRLEARRGPLVLNLEIVRPATFAALEEHLEKAREAHGPGYFHIVHFDMHGRIGRPKGSTSREGFLLFSKPAAHGTTAVSGHALGGLLQKHSVPIVVLNACNSARACFGDDANIAKSFLSHGVSGVLGMSFKVTTKAVTLFLEAFYSALLADGVPFTVAAAAGRTALRKDSTRPARYGTQRHLDDSFIAATYLNYPDFALTQPKNTTPAWLHAPICSPYLPPRAGERIVGRDFDLLRLEKQLLENGAAYIHGVGGVGKTAFLGYAASLWTSTGFPGAVVAADLADGSVSSGHDLSLAVLDQLLALGRFPEQLSRLWSMPHRSLRSYDDDTISSVTRQILSEMDVLIILDSLHIPLASHLSSAGSSAWDETAKADLVRRIASYAELAQDRNRDRRCYLVLAGRAVDPAWLRGLLKEAGDACLRYELRGLELPDAMELSHQVLRRCGLYTQGWREKDSEWLEAIIDLLQGIPCALEAVLPLCRKLNIRWPEFYSRLQRGLFGSVAELKDHGLFSSSKICQELERLSTTLLRSHFLLLCLPGIYWNKAASFGKILAILAMVMGPSFESDFASEGDTMNFMAQLAQFGSELVGFAVDHGYVHVDKNGISTSVHPLLTIVGRQFVWELLGPASAHRLRHLFCASMESADLGPDGDGGAGGLVTESANVLTVIDFCLQDVAPEEWPLHFLTTQVYRDLHHLPPVVRRLLQERMLQLLEGLAKRIPSVREKAPYTVFFSLQLFLVTSLGRLHDGALNFAGELASKGLCLVAPKGDEPLGTDDIVCRGYLQLCRLFSSYFSRRPSEARESFQELRSIKEMLSAELGPGAAQPLMLAAQQLASASENTQDWTRIVRDSLVGRPSLADSQIQEPGLFRLILMACIMSVEDDETLTQVERLAVPEMLGRGSASELQVERDGKRPPHVDVEQFKRMLGYRPLDVVADPPAILIGLQGGDGRGDLDALESAYDASDWGEAWVAHIKMIITAFQNCRFQEANEHLRFARAALVRVEEEIPRRVFCILDELERAIHDAYIRYITVQSLYASRPGSQEDTATRICDAKTRAFDMIECFLSAGVTPPEMIREILPKEALPEAEKIIGGLPDPHKAAELWWEESHKVRAQDGTWVRTMYADLAAHDSRIRCMDKIFESYVSRRFESALSTVGELEALLSDRPPHESMDFSSLQDLRSCLEVHIEQTRRLEEWQKALAEDDFEGAERITAELEHHARPTFVNQLTDMDMEAMRKAAEREHLVKFTLDLHGAATTGDAERYHRTYRELVDLVQRNRLSRIDAEQLMSLRCEALGWLMGRAAEARSWQDGLSYCDEFLDLTRSMAADYPRTQDDCLNIKEQCEHGLVMDSLSKAESRRDFQECLRLVRELEESKTTRSRTPGRSRSVFILLGRNSMAFLRGSYEDGCVSCARWIRRESQEGCSCLGGRGPHHNRRDFARPFGCEHHCGGGYCFNS